MCTGAIHLDQTEIRAVEQLVDGLLRAEGATERRGLHIAQQGFVKQQLDFCLLCHITQGTGQ